MALDRSSKPSLVDKLQKSSHPSHSNSTSNINVAVPYFPKSSFSIAKILKQYHFKINFLHSPVDPCGQLASILQPNPI